MIDQEPTKRLSPEKLKSFLQKVFNIVLQKPLSDFNEEETTKVINIVKNTQFFQKNLDSQINMDEFMDRLKYHLNYETYPYGTILFNEGQYANKYSIIIKGSAVKFHNRSLNDIQQEAAEKAKAFQKEKEEQELLNKKKQAYEAVHQAATIVFAEKSPTRTKRSATMKNLVNMKSSQTKIEEPKSPRRLGLLVSIDQTNSDSEEDIEENTLITNSSLMYLTREKTHEGEYPIIKNSITKLPLVREASKSTSPKKLLKKQTIEEPLIAELEEGAESDNEEGEKRKAEEIKKKAEMKKFKEMMEKESDAKLFHYISKTNPQAASKYFLGDIVKLKRSREYLPGEHFGENFIKLNKPKEALLVAAEEIHLLTLTKENYSSIMSHLYEKVKEKVDFFATVFPSLNDEILKSFAYYFKEKAFKKGERIYMEDEVVDSLYLLQFGNVQLFKRLDGSPKEKLSPGEHLLFAAHKGVKSDLPVASVMEKQFFGEELLLKEPRRQYIAISKTSGTKVYFLEAWLYQKIKANFVGVLKTLRAQAVEKANWRKSRLQSMTGKAVEVMERPTHEKLMSLDLRKTQTIESNSTQYKLRLDRSLSPLQLTKGQSSEDGEYALGSEKTRGQGQYLHKERVLTEAPQCEDPVSKNLTIYKERFFRKTYMNKVLANETFLKINEHSREMKDSRDPFAQTIFEAIAPSKRHEKKFLSQSNDMSQTSKILSSNLYRESNKNLSQYPVESTLPSIDTNPSPEHHGVKDLRSKVLKVLTPKYKEGKEGKEEVIKSSDGSLKVVAESSKLRGILKSFDQIFDAEAIHRSPNMDRMRITTIQNSKTSPKALRLKSLRKIHVLREHFKSPSMSPERRNSKPLSLEISKQALKIDKINL